ncbi:MAG: RlmE family RNA methyltransferase, partial [Duodenibacillus sp.]|nr:RlmE family RNA methyltransferase [Duodenibacillus sp.]
ISKGVPADKAFKIMELLDKDRLLAPGMSVVDLGSAPGSWTQVLCERLRGEGGAMRGKVVALDILPMEPVEGAVFLQGDFREQEAADRLAAELGGGKIDLVVSDMAPNLSGVPMVDAIAGALLNELALDFACEHLKPSGAFVVKVFQGSGYSQFVEKVKRRFKSVAHRKPEASRDSSAEMYLVAKGLKPA